MVKVNENEARRPLSFVKTVQTKETTPTSPVVNATSADGVAAIFGPLLAIGAAQLSTPQCEAVFDGQKTTLQVAKLSRLTSENVGDANVVDAVFADAIQRLRTLTSRFAPGFEPTADPALGDPWTRLTAATTTANKTLRERFLAQAKDDLDDAKSTLCNERALCGLFALAAVECRLGRLANALKTLEAAASYALESANGNASGEEAQFWACWQIRLETRDFLSSLAERPLLTDFWRKKGELLKDWADAPVAEAERRQAAELWRATTLFSTDFAAAVEALNKGRNGVAQALNEEANEICERTFGERDTPKPARDVPSLATVARTLATAGLTSTQTLQPASSGAASSAWAVDGAAGTREILRFSGVEWAFRYCPSGTFAMGSPSSEAGRESDELLHTVTLTRGFWALETPVTQEMWRAVVGTNPSWFSATGGGSDLTRGVDTSRFPVECVSWNDCSAFVKLLNNNGWAPNGFEFRLPWEAEWEYACRAGTTTPFFWGATLNGDNANCCGDIPYGARSPGERLGRTRRVGSYSANPWGLYDMHGNVWEWCADLYKAYRGAATDPAPNRNGFAELLRGVKRVLRGGCWGGEAKTCRSAYRHLARPEQGNRCRGLRLVLARKD